MLLLQESVILATPCPKHALNCFMKNARMFGIKVISLMTIIKLQLSTNHGGKLSLKVTCKNPRFVNHFYKLQTNGTIGNE
jgi:hypothetical protein